MSATTVRPIGRKPFTAEIQQRRDVRVSNERILEEIKSLETRLEKLAVGSIDVEGHTPGTLLDQVERTKKEISTLITQNTKDDRLATAARELQAVVRATEGATFTIIDIAERVDELLHDLRSHTGDSTVVATADEISETTTDLYEACNFQDITGQRIKKVVNTLQFVEERLAAMIDIWGADALSIVEHSKEVRDEETHLLQGPQMEEDAIAQEDIDKLFE